MHRGPGPDPISGLAVNGSADDAYDNDMCKSLFGTPACELFERHRFRTKVAARLVIVELIEGWKPIHEFSHLNLIKWRAMTNPKLE